MADVPKIVLFRDEVRPNTDVEFWHQTDEETAYIENTYKVPGLLISDEITLSEDQLTKTRVQTWARIPGMVSTIREDEELINQSSKNVAYNEAHGITRSPLHYKIIGLDDTVKASGTFVD